MERIELTTESEGTYVFRGHGLNKEEILKVLKEDWEAEAEIGDIEETGGHWGFAPEYADDRDARFLYWDKKYLKSKGGFPITVVHCN